ncbi:MAG: hypothetical protein RL196_1173 [Actinomycetota bacterium]
MLEYQWPASRTIEVDWRQETRSGKREDRLVRRIQASVPTQIADEQPFFSASLMAKTERSSLLAAELDATAGSQLGSLSSLLMRAESAASSKIEGLAASPSDFARATYGSKSNSTAVEMVDGAKALQWLVNQVQARVSVDLAQILHTHQMLFASESDFYVQAGQLRTVQNWIQGSNYSPLGAMHVPPPPELVPDLMQDLIAFINREDLPVLVQAAIAHAQFENIHPFVDGNGRIGRALVSVILRRRGVSKVVTIPLAAALGATRESYFACLSEWRLGNALPIIELFATGLEVASLEAATTADVIATLPKLWQERLGPTSAANLASKALAFLTKQPIFNAIDVAETLGVALTSTYPAIAKLEAADIIRPLTDRTRNQIWGTIEVLEELEQLELRIAARMSKGK